MTRASDQPMPCTVSESPPAGVPVAPNLLRDQHAGQLEIVIAASGGAVELGAVGGGGRTTYWYYDATRASWGVFAPYAHQEGWSIAAGQTLADIVRMPRNMLALHVEMVGAFGVGNAVVTAQTVRGGV